MTSRPNISATSSTVSMSPVRTISILTRLTTVGAIYLVVVCLIPQFMISGFKVQAIPFNRRLLLVPHCLKNNRSRFR